MLSPYPKDARALESFANILSRSDVYTALRAGFEQVNAVDIVLKEALPDYLCAGMKPGSIKNGRLTLFAAHNALGARLRHLEPMLIAQLQLSGFAVDRLKVRVSPRIAPAAPPPKQARITPAAAQCLKALSDTLEPSPLKDAVARMVKRHGEYS